MTVDLLYRFGNAAQLDSSEAQPVSISVTDSTGQRAAAQCPQLDPPSVQGISMSPAQSSLLLGPVLVAANATAASQAYSLSIRVAGVPQALIVAFNFTDAAGWTQDQQAAQQRRSEAQRSVNTHTASLGAKRGHSAEAEEAVQRALAGAQNSLGAAVNLDNWGQIQEECQQHLRGLPAPRGMHMQRQVLRPQRRVELSTVPGVIGFGYELIHVINDDDARLLSWYAQASLHMLFVTTWAAQKLVEAKWTEWELTTSQRLNFVVLEAVSPMKTDLHQQRLPHEGLLLNDSNHCMHAICT